MKYVAPALGLNSFTCPHCNALAHQEWYSLRARHEKHELPSVHREEGLEEWLQERLYTLSRNGWEDDKISKLGDTIRRSASGDIFFKDDSRDGFSEGVYNVHLSMCFSCKKFSLWRYDSVVWPVFCREYVPNSYMPDGVRKDFIEASQIVDKSSRAACALLRLAMERLCNNINDSSDMLNDGIAKLVKAGVPSKVQQALDIVRVKGNSQIHDGKSAAAAGQIEQDDTRETAHTLFWLVNWITERMIADEQKIDEMYANLPEGKLRGIENRDK